MRVVLLKVVALSSVGCGPATSALASLHERSLHVAVGPDATGSGVLVSVSVTGDDGTSGCLTLDSDTEITIANKKFELGTPHPTDDDCPDVKLVRSVADDHLDVHSPTLIRMADSSLAMEMTVTNLLVPRAAKVPDWFTTCSSIDVPYVPTTDRVRVTPTQISFGSSEGALFSTFASAVMGSTIRFDIPWVGGAPANQLGAGTASIQMFADVPVDTCRNATTCEASASTDDEVPVVVSDGCR